MKSSLALFIIFMLFASLLPKKKCDCDDAHIELKLFNKGKLLYVADNQGWSQLHQPAIESKVFGGKTIYVDSVKISLIK